MNASPAVSLVNESATVEATAVAVAAATAAAEFVGFAVVKGKGATSAKKVAQAINNGAPKGALIALNIGRKATIDALKADGMAEVVHAVAHGIDYRPAIALVVAAANMPFTAENDNGKINRASWLRLRVEVSKAGNKASVKALSVYDAIQRDADAIRALASADRAAITA